MRDDFETYSRRGEVIAGAYAITEVIGIGGMGIVYAAVQRSLDRIVAVKLPRPELAASPHVRRMMRNEALASSRVDHRNAVRVLDYGDHLLAPYLVMEHIPGPRLATVLAENRRLPMDVAIPIMRQVVSVLAEAHRNGIVHADVKCDNVLVEVMRNGAMVPRLIDWGISHFIDAGGSQYGCEVTGTPDYLAPEVMLGAAPGFTADVFAAGVMLYELLSGTTPFARTSDGMYTPIVPLAIRSPDLELPRTLDMLLAQALAFDPEARFQDAEALGRALDRLDQPLPARDEQEFGNEPATETMRDEPGPAIVAYLERARELVDGHRLADAIDALERGVAAVSALGGRSPVWRLLLALAALYDGVGNRRRALDAAGLARECATHEGSDIGCERARLLLARLAPPPRTRSQALR